jgi:hypothetical protein
MDFQAYREANFADPLPEPRFSFTGSFGATLYYEEYSAATAFYERVLGPPSFCEGAGTRGWRIGTGWLTLLQGKEGNPQNVEITLELPTASEAEALHSAFVAAGGMGSAPSDQLIYRPVRACPVIDPFGLEILIIGPLGMKGTGSEVRHRRSKA